MSLMNLIESLPPHLTRYEYGLTPFSTLLSVLFTLACYFIIIFGLQEFMRKRRSLRFTALFQLYNLFLSAGSFVLLLLIVQEMMPIVYTHGLFYGICAEESWTPKLEFYSMINYYFKYVELIDTLFMVIKKKPLSFLHVFHHSATVFLVYIQLNNRTSIMWLAISMNLAIHVLMYYYYFASAGGHKIWWKKYLTSMQMIQFAVVIPICYFAIYTRFASLHFPRLPNMGTCASPFGATFLGASLYTSYLYLFFLFYKNTYEKAPASKESSSGTATRTVITPQENGILEHAKVE